MESGQGRGFWALGTNVKEGQRAFRLASNFTGSRGLLARKWALAKKGIAKSENGVMELLVHLQLTTSGETSGFLLFFLEREWGCSGISGLYFRSRDLVYFGFVIWQDFCIWRI